MFIFWVCFPFAYHSTSVDHSLCSRAIFQIFSTHLANENLLKNGLLRPSRLNATLVILTLRYWLVKNLWTAQLPLALVAVVVSVGQQNLDTRISLWYTVLYWVAGTRNPETPSRPQLPKVTTTSKLRASDQEAPYAPFRDYLQLHISRLLYIPSDI